MISIAQCIALLLGMISMTSGNHQSAMSTSWAMGDGSDWGSDVNSTAIPLPCRNARADTPHAPPRSGKAKAL